MTSKKGSNYRHGYYGTPTYKSWSEMKYRCNHNIKRYKYISYCERWDDFNNFLEDMGERPLNTTLDRIDSTKGYSPSNCRWANNETQQNNKISNRYYFIDGEKMTLSQIARKYKISRSNLANKVYIYKWNINDAINYLIGRRCHHSIQKNV